MDGGASTCQTKHLMVEFLFLFHLLINIVRYTTQAPLWRHTYRRFFRLPDFGEEARSLQGQVLFRDAQIILSR